MSIHELEARVGPQCLQPEGGGWLGIGWLDERAPAAPAAVVVLEEPVDGRLARSRRTRERIVRSLVEFVDKGEWRPTAAMIAESAAVSRRAFYLHFDGVEDVLAAAFEQRLIEMSRSWRQTCVLGTSSERVTEFCHKWGEFLEQMTPLFRAAATCVPESVALGDAFERIQEWVRSVVEWAFLPDLIFTDGLDQEVSVRSALYAVTSWNMWDGLRRAGSTVEEATATMARVLCAAMVS